MEKKLVNLTPHEVVIYDPELGKQTVCVTRRIPSIGNARVSSKSVPGASIDGISFAETVFGAVEGLPEPDGETVYIVSQMVISALPNRADLVRPDTGPTCARDAEGKIIAVAGLTR